MKTRSEPGPWRTASVAVVLTLAVAGMLVEVLSGAEDGGKNAKDKNGLIEVRKDGYVEKIDPNVDYKDRLPRIPPRKPAESMKAFHIVPGIRLEQVATEPLVRDPVDLCFDENGRMYVAEMIPYAEDNSAKYGSPNGRVSLLEDTDGDGKFDKTRVFADKLVWPTGVMCFDGGIFVAATPELLYFKDTNGDGKADLREVVLTGFPTGNPNGVPGSLRWGLDSRIHGMPSTGGGQLKAVRWERGAEGRKAEPIQARGRDFSFHPRTGELRLESGGAQYGMSFDQWGRKFTCSNSAPIYMIMYEDRYIARNPYLAAPGARIGIWSGDRAVYRTSPVEPWRILRTELRVGGTFTGPIEGGGTPAGYFTGVSGIAIYTGGVWPKEFQGNAFCGEGSSNIVHRRRLEPNGVGFKAVRTEEKSEFIASDEIWFRPVQFAIGPDGNLYMADMYREVYEHPGAVPPSAKKHIDLSTGNDRGRIYRLMPDGFKQPKPVRLGKMSTEELVPLLAHSNSWHRRTASRLLYERQDPKAVEPMKKLAAESSSPLGRMHAMYALDGQDALTADVVLPRLDDKNPRVREHAVRLSEKILADSPTVRAKLYEMVGDEDMRVRYQLAFTLGEISGSQATAALAAIAGQDAGDKWVRTAILSSSLGRAGELFSRLATDEKWRSNHDVRMFLDDLAEQAGLQDREAQVAEVLKSLEGFSKDDKKLAQAVVHSLGKGLKKAGSPLLARLKSGSGSVAGRVLAEMVKQSKKVAVDGQKPVDQRVEAVHSLALASFDEARNVLYELLDSRQPQAVQVASIQALSRFQDPSVAEMIVDAWLGFSPQVRGEAAEALFARPQRLSTLLGAIEDEVIRPSQLDPARVQSLITHSNKEIRDRAKRLLSSAKLAPREQVVAAWRDVLKMKGDTARGKDVFKRECSKCHRLEGVGVELGLPLETIGNRGPETILLNVLDPNREVNPAYLNYVIVTTEGQQITGMITEETATSITLKRAEGETDTVLRTNIEELENTGLSIMPEGQEKLINKQEMADVIAYLMSIK